MRRRSPVVFSAVPVLVAALVLAACTTSTGEPDGDGTPTPQTPSTAEATADVARPSNLPQLFDAVGAEIPVTTVLDEPAVFVALGTEQQYAWEATQLANVACDGSLTGLFAEGNDAGARFGSPSGVAISETVSSHFYSPAAGDDKVLLFFETGEAFEPDLILVQLDPDGITTLLDTAMTPWSAGYTTIAGDGGIWLQAHENEPGTGELNASPIVLVTTDGSWVIAAENGEMLGHTDRGALYSLTPGVAEEMDPGAFELHEITPERDVLLLSGRPRAGGTAGMVLTPTASSRSGELLVMTFQRGQGEEPYLVVVEDGEATLVVLDDPARHVAVTDGWIAWSEGRPEDDGPWEQYVLELAEGSIYRLGTTEIAGLPSLCGDQLAWDEDDTIHVGTLP
ncbi:MAG TPA: hypothetical protein VFC82_04315 [Actinomycetaceae bacterium]|nr:hypothetical protein [Actinomycetaceae bacterium]